MYIFLAILGTLIFDWVGSYIYQKHKAKQIKRDTDLLIFKLETILSDKNTDTTEKIEKAKYECRMTEGHYASGVYHTLDIIEKNGL